MGRFALITSIILFSLGAEARVFDFKKVSMGSYFKVNYGTSQLGDNGYADSSGASTNFSEKTSYVLGGELGFLFNMGFMGVRLGANVFVPENMLNMAGTNAGGTELMRVSSNITGVMPAGHLEIYLYETKTTKVVASAGVASGNVTLMNKYSLSAAGAAAYPGVNNHTVEAAGTALMTEVAFGYEFNMVDNVTVLGEAGYRYLYLGDLKHQRSGTSFGGAYTKGDKLLKNDGGILKLNLSGPFVGLALRFYFN